MAPLTVPPDNSDQPNRSPADENPYAYSGSGEFPVASGNRAEVWGLGVLFGAMYFIQGIAEPTEGLVSQPVKSLLDSWKEPVARISLFAALIAIPWSIKPLFGLLADFVPFFGSRLKGYLILCNLTAVLGLGAIYFIHWRPGSTAWLCLALLVPTAAVAFSDVLVDALMIQKGQPRGLTGTFQGVQWAAIYTATILTGWLGGWLSQHNQQELGFLICALVTLPALLLSVFFVHERERIGPRPSFAQALRDLRDAARSPALWAVAAFLFLWNFNPFSSTVQQLHMTNELGFSPQFYGTTVSLSAFTSVVASGLYVLYGRLVPRNWLIHASIVLGVLSTLGYWWLGSETSAVVITLVFGFAYMTATLIQLELAAQACPPRAAGTVFAMLMALSNFAVSLSTGVGGSLYDSIAQGQGKPAAFHALVAIGAACTACCWGLYPWLRAKPSPS